MRLGFFLLIAIGIAICGCENEEDCCYEPTCGDREAPAIPSGVYSVTGDGLITIYWNPVMGSDVKGYGVWWSPAVDSPYVHMADVMGEASYYYEDREVVNRNTYFYAVTAFDHSANESDLSIEDVFDTPRPEGFDVTIYTAQEDSSLSGIDFAEVEDPNFADDDLLVPWDGPGTDIYLDSMSDNDPEVLRFVAVDGAFIQDFGYVDRLDQIDWAPEHGWSFSPLGVEAIRGHAYVVQTADTNYAKFRIERMNSTNGWVNLD